ncbi:MAG: hypothetical protein KGR26_02635 [Cyanobacteria bacterium REEB65]|nr:hypothetical protein [Cyanobacteria bacterium REEB65]
MDERVEIKGVWWDPAKPEDQVPGILVYQPADGLTLELIGIIGDLRPGPSRDLDVIHGQPSSGGPITLLKCLSRGERFSAPGFMTESYLPHYALVGHHFADRNSCTFLKWYVELSGLDEWCCFSPFQTKHSPDYESHSIEYTRPQTIEVQISDGLNLAIGVNVSGAVVHQANKKASIAQRAFVKFEARAETELRQVTRSVFRLRQFLALATRQPVKITKLTAYTDANKEEADGRVRQPQIEILFEAAGADARVPESLDAYRFLFTRPMLGSKLSDGLRGWFASSATLAPVYDLHFALRARWDGMSAEQRFLTASQALETFHRRTSNELDLPEEDHAKRLAEILEGVPEKHTTWLKGQLTYSNELHLRQRLKRMARANCTALKPIIPKIGPFVSRVVERRNYLTHYDPSRPYEVDGIELYWLTRRLIVLLEVCLLGVLGLDSEEVERLVAGNRWIQSEFRGQS